MRASKLFGSMAMAVNTFGNAAHSSHHPKQYILSRSIALYSYVCNSSSKKLEGPGPRHYLSNRCWRISNTVQLNDTRTLLRSRYKSKRHACSAVRRVQQLSKFCSGVLLPHTWASAACRSTSAWFRRPTIRCLPAATPLRQPLC